MNVYSHCINKKKEWCVCVCALARVINHNHNKCFTKQRPIQVKDRAGAQEIKGIKEKKKKILKPHTFQLTI